MNFESTFTYACTAADLHATLTDPAHVAAKLAATGPGEVLEVGSRLVKIRRQITATVPGFASKFVSDNQEVVQVEEWTDIPTEPTAAYAGSFGGTAQGVPVTVNGTLRIEPSGESSDLQVRGQVSVNVPFFGAKIAELVREQIVKNLEREHAFTATWIAEHR